MREDDLDEVMRAPIGENRARQILDHLQTFEGETSDQWKTRANAHQRKMDEGEPFGYAEVYKSLRVREQEGSLSAADRKHLKQSAEFLSEELANALGTSNRQALKKINQATRTGD